MAGKSGKYSIFRNIRTAVAVLMFLLITGSFMFFSHRFDVLSHLLHFQFVPALLLATGAGLSILLTFTVLTLVFGRVYCSWICPLGIWQDIVARISGWLGAGSKKAWYKRTHRYSYHKPHSILRWSILAAVLTAAFSGILYPLMILGPYSNWGRIVRTLLSPVIQLFANLLSYIFPETVYYTPMAEVSAAMFAVTLLFFLFVTGMSFFRGRLYCNTVCPIGSILGAVSRISLFHPVIDKSVCVACGSCSSKCKSECIDLENKEIDSSRCVMCLDCMTSCAKGGVTLAFRYGKRSSAAPAGDGRPQSAGRRDAVMALGTVGALALVNRFRDFKPVPDTLVENTPGGVLPPGSVSMGNLINNCIACHACISSCPSGIITYASGEYGLQGLFLPVIHYDRGFCRYDCHKCGDTCPTGAIGPLTIEEKRRTQIGRVEFTARNCIVFRDKTDCGACDEHCPTKAITMVEWRGRTDGLRFPSINPDICVGCGACEYVCPAAPVKAMKIRPLPVHGTSLPPKEEKQETVTVSDFGF